MSTVIAVAAGAVVAILAALGLRRHGFTGWSLAIGAISIGGIFGLALGDVIVGDAGRYWADHPTLAAAIVGVLFLVLTVLVVDKVVEISVTRRVRGASRKTLAALVATPQDPLLTALRRLLDDAQPPDPAKWKAAANEAASRLETDIAKTLPAMMLLATDENLFDVFDRVGRYREKATSLERACREQAGVPGAVDDDRRTDVEDEWRRFVAATVALREEAERAKFRL